MAVSDYGVRLAGVTFSNPALPITRDYDREIGQHADCLGFYSPDSDLVTLNSTKVVSVTDRSALLRTLSHETDANRPIFRANGGPNDRPYLEFPGSGIHLKYPTGLWPVDVAGGSGPYVKWSRCLLIKPAATPTAGENRIFMGSTGGLSGAGRHFAQMQGVNKLLFRVGNAGGPGASLTYDPAAWIVMINCWDGALGKAAMSVNGAGLIAATSNDAIATDPTFALGGASSGATFLAGTMVLTKSDLSDLTLPANVTLLASIKQMYRDRYGVPVA